MKKRYCANKFSIEKISSLFKALGDSNRMAIFDYLCSSSGEGQNSANVNKVSTCCDVDLSVVSRHLNTLKRAGVLNAQKRGKEVFYGVNTEELAQILRKLADHIDPPNQGDKDE